MTKKIMVQGQGPSKMHRDPAARSAYEALKSLHVGGKPVEELPEDMVVRLCYDHTDEAIEERNRGKAESAAHVRKVAGDRAPVSGTEFNRQLDEVRDFRTEGMQPWEAPDPMKELAEKHTPPGFRHKFLSPAQCDKRGMRGWEALKNKAGDLIKVGRMFLGIMPEERAQARDSHYRKKGADRLAAIEQNYQEQQRSLTGA